MKSTGVPDSFSNAALVLICDLVSNATFVFNTSVDRMQLLPCSPGVPTSFYKLIVTCLSKNVSGDYSSLL